ncbi:UPF0187 chloroplastic [Micractinium conductrix]|uniref:UPF0187 chloroplastic n=1 Tax=Micractinium conductrix TaxID=554055 RepID=A0A2P6VMY4_9CHLO|nr:UPF0187 chloroplastic [Micractinium conductrix]|eukprot:PSC75458.1 UPF0187 chloroplastic [Micractinium conductrix]
MPRTENSYTHGARGSPSLDPEGSPLTQHARNSSLQNLARLPGVARAKLQNLSQTKFVRYIEDNDDGSRDENDIYRQHPGDQVFTFERWNKHRDSFRYAKHLAHMFSSRVFKQLLGPVLCVSALALAVGVYETLVAAGKLPGHWPHVTLALGQGFNLTAFALSLLLVFRTNSSYDRWWEARKLWGGVVNRTRDFVRQSLVFFRDEDAHLRELLAKWTIAFPHVLMCHLREHGDVAKAVAMMAEIVRTARPPELCRMRMDENLSFFEDAMGSMERILRTPIPLSLVWLILLPFTLWAAYSWFSVLLSGIFAFLMFGIDEIGVQIEEPFGILPLEAISSTIERNIRELLARNDEVVGLVAQAAQAGAVAAAAAAAADVAVAALPQGGQHDADAATVLAVPGDEFGEMVAAGSPVGKEPSAGNLITLTASSGEAAAAAAAAHHHLHAAARRVQFGGATVIEVGGSDEEAAGGGGGSPLGSPSHAHSPHRALNRQASMVEVELASGASPLLSPTDGSSAPVYSNWLRD